MDFSIGTEPQSKYPKVKHMKGQLHITDWEMVYILGYAGIRLKEKAAKLTGVAEAFGDLIMTPSDVI